MPVVKSYGGILHLLYFSPPSNYYFPVFRLNKCISNMDVIYVISFNILLIKMIAPFP